MTDTREIMIIEIVTTDPRAPTVAQQKAANREDGTAPEKTFEFPEWRGDISAIIYEKDDDVVVVATPKVFGTMAETKPVLERMARAGALLKLPSKAPEAVETAEDQQRVLDMIARERWRKPSAKQRRNPGRPTKRSQPSDDVRRVGGKMWLRPRSKDDPEGYTRRQVLEFHEEEMGRAVKDWELKHWYGDKRSSVKEKTE